MQSRRFCCAPDSTALDHIAGQASGGVTLGRNQRVVRSPQALDLHVRAPAAARWACIPHKHLQCGTPALTAIWGSWVECSAGCPARIWAILHATLQPPRAGKHEMPTPPAYEAVPSNADRHAVHQIPTLHPWAGTFHQRCKRCSDGGCPRSRSGCHWRGRACTRPCPGRVCHQALGTTVGSECSHL